MLPYYILLIIPLFIYLLGYAKGKRWNKQCIILFFTILIILLSLRSIECGTDLQMYSDFFKVISNYSFSQTLDFSSKGEVLFFLLNKIVWLIGGNFQVLLIITAIISIVPIAYVYSKKSENGLLTISLFLTVVPFAIFFSGLRQAIAMGLVIFSFQFIEKKKPIKYIICILITMYFHKSASVALLFYPIYHSKITKNWLYIIIPLYLIVYLFNTQIFSYFVQLYNPIYEETYGYTTSTGQYSTLFVLIIFSIYCFVFPDKNKISREYIGLRNLLLLAILFQLFVPINPIVMRMNYYTLLFVPILIPKVSSIGYEKDKRILQVSRIIMVLFFFSYFIYDGYNGKDVLNIFPYIPFWR